MWVLMVIEGWSSVTPDIKLKLIGRIGEKREDLVGFAGWESSCAVAMGWQGAVLEQHSTILGGVRVSLGLERQTQRCFCRQGGVTVSPFIPSLFPMLILGCSTPGKELIYFCTLPKRGDNAPHVGPAAPIISWQSRKVLIVSNGASMLHPGVKNSVLPCSKFSKASTINAQFLAVPLG